MANRTSNNDRDIQRTRQVRKSAADGAQTRVRRSAADGAQTRVRRSAADSSAQQRPRRMADSSAQQSPRRTSDSSTQQRTRRISDNSTPQSPRRTSGSSTQQRPRRTSDSSAQQRPRRTSDGSAQQRPRKTSDSSTQQRTRRTAEGSAQQRARRTANTSGDFGIAIEKNQGRKQSSGRKQRKKQEKMSNAEIKRQKMILKKKRKELKKLNRPIVLISYLVAVLFIVMGAYFINFMVNDSENVINNPYNKRDTVLTETVIRGDIVSADGQILAKTVVADDGSESRSYPYSNVFSHSVGYSTRGMSGIESLMNYKLLTSNAPVNEIAVNELNGDKNMGDTVVTTFDTNMTVTAYNALGTYQGAIIGIEPSTGKILFMVSKPDFDPNTIVNNYDTIVSDANNTSLLNRATNGSYTPGSTFKFFSLLEYINENPTAYDDYSFYCKGSTEIEGSSISCSDGKSHGSEDLMDSFANSCNCSFATLGLDLDKTRFKTLCESLYFNNDLPTDIDYKKSSFSLDATSSTFDTMQTVIGQGKTLVSPLHLAMIASAVANNGVLMRPYVVTEINNYLGTNVKTYDATSAATLFTEEQVNVLSEYMRAVVKYGTATKLNDATLYTAYGKTGTAQINDGSQVNALFMGYAKNDNGKALAICIVMENVGDGISPVVPTAKTLFDTYFSY